MTNTDSVIDLSLTTSVVNISAENKKLERLNLSWNNIRGKGAVAIFKGIKVSINENEIFQIFVLKFI